MPAARQAAATANGLDATTDPDIIRAWWQQSSDNNIAVATGAASGIFVVDVDGRRKTTLRRLEAQYGALPATVKSSPLAVGIYSNGRKSRCVIPRARSVRTSMWGDGGYVLSPPSIHPSGRRYSWSVDSANYIAEAPGWLLAKQKGAAIATTTPSSDWRALIEGVSEGARDCSVAKLAGHLLRHHVDPFITLGLLQSWNATNCMPPLPSADIERIVNSIAGKELRRRGNG